MLAPIALALESSCDQTVDGNFYSLIKINPLEMPENNVKP
jgi:hypothetical protein